MSVNSSATLSFSFLKGHSFKTRHLCFLFVAMIGFLPYYLTQSSTTFSYNGTMQTYVVPSGITMLGVDASGAQGGGSATYGPGGNGGRVTCTLNVTAGSTLNIFVGQMPGTLTGGFNGGGNGAVGTGGTGGGGATDIRVGGTGLSNRILVAGGGGGSGFSGAGQGGGLVGGNGSTPASGTVATGGSQSAGGIGGSYNFGTCSPGMSAANGSLGLGGNGVTGVNGCSSYGGSGGGGGYYGGGGMQVCGAGGGSNYTDASASNVTHTQGYQTGNGLITLVPLFGAVASQTNVSCHGGTNGSAIITTTTGLVTGPFTYSWLPSGSTSSVLTGLSAGTYTCLVSAAGNTAKVIVTITEPGTMSCSVLSQTNVSCFNGSNGAVMLNVGGGTAPYSYTWSPVSANTPGLSGLSAGNYTATVVDANNCSAVQQVVTITQPSTFSVSAVASNTGVCAGNTTTLFGSGASTYSWSGGISNGVSFTPSTSTVYSVTGLSTLGCLSSNVATISITVYNLPTITVNSGSICLGNSFTIFAYGTGAATFTYSGGTNVVTPTVSTTYSVSSTNTAGCLSNTVVCSVTVNTLPIITVNSGSICSGSSFTMTPSGAVTYTFSGGNSVISPTTTSSYSVSGTGTNGCVSGIPAVSTVTVFSLPTISVNSGSICTGQSFTINPSGAASYTYSGGSNIVTPSATAVYSVTGTSSIGCVNLNPALSVVVVNLTPTLTVNSGSICSGQTFTIIPSGVSNYTLTTGTTVLTPTSNLTFTAIGMSSQGCYATNPAVGTVSVYISPTVSAGNGTICSGQIFTINPSGANSYSFSGGNAIVSPLTTSSYTVTGYNLQGCVSSNSPVVTILVKAVPSLTLSGPNAVCIGSSITELANTSAISYTWNTGSNSNLITLSPTVNTVCSITVTGSNGCTNTITKTISVNPLPVVTASANTYTLCAGEGLLLTGYGANTYSWSGGVINNFTLYPTSIIVYTVTGTDLNGCSNTATIMPTVKPSPTLITTHSPSLTCTLESATLSVSGANSYLWSNGTNDSSLVITPSVTTSYTVSGFGPNGCSSKAVITQSVSDCTSLDDIKTLSPVASIYPNPNNGSFVLRINSNSASTQLEIYNSLGNLILKQDQVDMINQINLENQARGIYILVLKENEKTRVTLKLIKD